MGYAPFWHKENAHQRMYTNAHGAPNKLSVRSYTNYGKVKKPIVSNLGAFGTYHHMICVNHETDIRINFKIKES